MRKAAYLEARMVRRDWLVLGIMALGGGFILVALLAGVYIAGREAGIKAAELASCDPAFLTFVTLPDGTEKICVPAHSQEVMQHLPLKKQHVPKGLPLYQGGPAPG